MKRFLVVAGIAMICVAQRPRDDYRAAYRAWREADPNFEKEVVLGGSPIAQRADRLGAEASKYGAARKDFLEGQAQDQAQQITVLESAATITESTALGTKFDAQFVASETATVTRTIDAFSSNPDKGLQQLTQALARERAALVALSGAISQRQKPTDAASVATTAIGRNGVQLLEQSRAMLLALKDATEGATRESSSWAEYYRKAGEGAMGTATPLTIPTPGAQTVNLMNPAAAPATITPVPLARYVGAWTFPQNNQMFHGPEPQFLEVLVQEDSGHAKGTLFGQFKVPSGGTGEGVLRFDFEGDFQPTRTQTFNLVTSDGDKGTIELIPGPAFNLLEINFQSVAKPGKISQADVVLVKK